MAAVEFQEGAIQIDAEVIAEGLAIEASQVQECLRQGKITTRYERGTGEDEGRHRITFFARHRRFRVTVDKTGAVVQRSIIKFAADAVPGSPQKSIQEIVRGT